LRLAPILPIITSPAVKLKARGAHQAWKTGHLGADLLRFALGFVDVALKARRRSR